MNCDNLNHNSRNRTRGIAWTVRFRVLGPACIGASSPQMRLHGGNDLRTFRSMEGDSTPQIRWLLLATLAVLAISWVPFAGWLNYPFLVFSTFIHETAHALAAILTGGEVESISVNWNGSGITYTRGGIRSIILSAGYVGTALFGGTLLILSKKRKWVRPALLGCALLILIMTLFFAGSAANWFVILAIAATIIVVVVAYRTDRHRSLWLAAGSIVLAILMAVLILTGSLSSWSIGIFSAASIIAVLRFASPSVSHFFLSLLAVLCSLNALEAIQSLWNLSLRTSCGTDAQMMSSLTGLPATLWAAVWGIQALIILAISLWLFASPRTRRIRKH